VRCAVEPKDEQPRAVTVQIEAPGTALMIADYRGQRVTFKVWLGLGPKDVNLTAEVVD
jgi:hypothetical protein